MKKLLTASLMLLALAGCSDDNGSGNNEIKKIELSRSEQDLNEAQTDFSFRLINSVGTDRKTENWVISPYTSFVNLSMLANGADDKLVGEFISVLGFPEEATLEDVNNYNKKLLEILPALDLRTKIIISNSNWVDENCTPVEEFAAITGEYYNAPLNVASLMDLKTNPNNPVNKWFSAKLEQPYMLKDVMDNLYSITANIIKFKGEWAYKFKKENTVIRNFTNYFGGKKSVPTMVNLFDKGFKHYYSDEVDVLSLEFGNGSYNMVVFLPENDLNDFISGFTAEKFRNLSVDYLASMANIYLPKFSFSYDINLTENLSDMGLKETVNGPWGGKFYKFYTLEKKSDFESILHNTYVSFGIDEEGGEVKALGSTQTGNVISPGPSSVVDFKVDRPFFFMIVESQTSTVLAAGAVYDL